MRIKRNAQSIEAGVSVQLVQHGHISWRLTRSYIVISKPKGGRVTNENGRRTSPRQLCERVNKLFITCTINVLDMSHGPRHYALEQ